MANMNRIFSFIIYFIVVSVFFVGCSKEQGEKKYKIGIIMPKYGYEKVLEGLRTAVDKSSYKGRIEFIVKDFPTNREEFESAVKILQGLDIDLFYTITTPATIATYEMIKNKPIIFAAVGDPVGVGLAESFKSPKKGITGVTNLSRELTDKRLEYFVKAFPKMKRILTFFNNENIYSILAVKDVENLSEKLKIKIEKVEVTSTDELRTRLKDKTLKEVDGIFIIPDPIVMAVIDDIIGFARENKIPTCVHEERFVLEKGATISYGVDLKDVGKISFIMIEHALSGGAPENLPIFVPEKMNLYVNNRWAKENGYVIPNEILYLADKVIE